jgi:Raf kinase inhibitor-like YbhB/YbcL family protein
MFTRTSASYTASVTIAITAPILASAQTAPATLHVTSPTLVAGQTVPRQHTADGENISPALQWRGAPATTRSFALVCDDPDVPIPGGFVHWVVYNIPATATGVPENLPIDPAAPMPAAIAGTVQGLSGFKRPIYRGPAPPPGTPHHYHFTVYALDVSGLPPGLTRAQLIETMQGHVVGQGELVTIYERKPPTPPPGR